MRPKASLALSALVAGLTLVAGAGTAAAADDVKPAPREVVKAPAVDGDIAAAADRIDEQGTALGSYWDSEKGQLAVVVGPDTTIGAAEAEKLAGGVPYRLERLKIAKKTADGIREEIGGQGFSPEAQKFTYASHLDLQTGRVILKTDAPASVTEGLVKEHPEIQLEESKPLSDLWNRRDDVPSFWGGASITGPGGTCSAGFTVKKPSGARFMTTAAHCWAVGSTVT